METNLNFEGLVGVRFVQCLLLVLDERYLLVWGFRAEDIAKGDVLETKVLSDVIIVGDVDPCGYPGYCQYTA